MSDLDTILKELKTNNKKDTAKETTSDLANIFTYNVNEDLRTIYITGEIDFDTCDTLIRAMDKFEAEDKKKPITLSINSEGGYVTHGWAMYDRIVKSKCPIIGISTGSCMSMATIILQACDTRLLTKHTCFMVHYGSQWSGGETISVENWNDYSRKIDKKNTENVYMRELKKKNSKFKITELRTMLSHDTILTAAQTVKLGLADRVV